MTSGSFPKHNGIDTSTNSMRLGQQAKDLLKLKPDKTPGQRRKTGHQVQFLIQTRFIIDSLLEREIRYIQYSDTG